MAPLTYERLYPHLTTDFVGRSYDYVEVVGSTNELARQWAASGPLRAPDGMAVVADEQTGGKGRRGRGWTSPGKQGVWASVILRPQLPAADAPKAALVTALAICRAIEDVTGTPASMEWPNDIIVAGRKVCGILVEMEANDDGETIRHMIVGFGVNVTVPEHAFPPEARGRAGSLATVVGQPVDRAVLLAAILKRLEDVYVLWCEVGFDRMRPLVRPYCGFLGHSVHVKEARRTWMGTAVDIGPDGALLVQRVGGSVVPVYAADVSVRPLDHGI